MHPFVKIEPIFEKIIRFCTHSSVFAPIHPKMNPLEFCILFIALSQQKRYSPCGCAFFVYKDGGFEIGRKLRSNLSAGPNSPVDCLSAKAATGGNPVIRTKKVVSF